MAEPDLLHAFDLMAEGIRTDRSLAQAATDLVGALRKRLEVSCGGFARETMMKDFLSEDVRAQGSVIAAVLRDHREEKPQFQENPCTALAELEWGLVRLADGNFGEYVKDLQDKKEKLMDLRRQVRREQEGLG